MAHFPHLIAPLMVSIEFFRLFASALYNFCIFAAALTELIMTDRLGFLKSARFWKEIMIMTLGLIAGAAAVYYFLLPGKLILGSISGLALIVSELLMKVGITLKVSVIILIFNAVLLVLAYVTMGAEIGLKTVFASLLLGPFMDLWELICPYTKLIQEGTSSVMGDPWLDLCAYVLLLGASQAFLFKINASTGGLDIVALIMNRKMHMEIGTAVTVSGAIVCAAAFLIHPFRLVVIGLIGTWINGVIVDYFTASINKRKRVCIISKEHEKIREYIIHELVRGCSLYEVKGGYTGNQEIEIQVLLTQSEFAKLMEYIRKNEFPAFITAGNCSEVYGLWLPHKVQKHVKETYAHNQQ